MVLQSRSILSQIMLTYYHEDDFPGTWHLRSDKSHAVSEASKQKTSHFHLGID